MTFVVSIVYIYLDLSVHVCFFSPDWRQCVEAIWVKESDILTSYGTDNICTVFYVYYRSTTETDICQYF